MLTVRSPSAAAFRSQSKRLEKALYETLVPIPAQQAGRIPADQKKTVCSPPFPREEARVNLHRSTHARRRGIDTQKGGGDRALI